ncbi:hypothetical protein V2A60_004076 [Cordyceps javanica]
MAIRGGILSQPATRQFLSLSSLWRTYAGLHGALFLAPTTQKRGGFRAVLLQKAGSLFNDLWALAALYPLLETISSPPGEDR